MVLALIYGNQPTFPKLMILVFVCPEIITSIGLPKPVKHSSFQSCIRNDHSVRLAQRHLNLLRMTSVRGGILAVRLAVAQSTLVGIILFFCQMLHI